MKIAVIGAGFFSMAFIKKMLHAENNQIMVWTESKELASKFNKNHKFEPLSKTFRYPENVFLSNDLEEVMFSAEIVIVLVNSQYFFSTIKAMKHYYRTNIPILVGTKGMDSKNKVFFSEYTRRTLQARSYSFFSGPTFAREITTDSFLSITIAGNNKKGWNLLQKIVHSSVVMEYTSDLYGLELLAVLKNIYALGNGILTGLKVKSSTEFTYQTFVLKEMNQFLNVFYGERATLFTFGGIGDYLMTSQSKMSRNFTFGKLLGEKKSKEEILKYLSENTVESYYLLEDFYKMNKKVRSNILPTLYKIAILGLDPERLLMELKK